jgi:hypothetical protein
MEEAVVAYSRYYSNTLLDGLKKTTNKSVRLGRVDDQIRT